MAETAETVDALADELADLEGELPGDDVPWIRTLRDDALERFRETGFPGPKNELWKYTDVGDVAAADLRHAYRAEPATLAFDDVEPFLVEDLDAHQAVFVDGRFDPDLSDLSGLPDAVTVDDLASVLGEDPDRLAGHLGEHAKLEVSFQTQTKGHVFSQLNTAAFTDGAVVEVDRSAIIEDPIHLVFLTTGHEPGLATHPRNLVLADENSEVTVVETYGGVGDGAEYLTNGITEIEAGDDAHVDHYKIQREAPDAFHVAQQMSVQGRAANVRTHNFTFGAELTRNDVNARLDGDGGNLTMNGLFSTKGDQHADNHTHIDHDAVGCNTHELYKGILDDASSGVFYGILMVRDEAQKTDAVQHNPNLLLSEEAVTNSTPQLEIFADDVTCTHGSTFGPISDDQLFYLRSRGMDEETARGLLTYAFAAEVLESVKVEPLRNALDELLLERLPKAAEVRDALGT
jgi:Fe-S cluster assembly protein SufD